MLRISRTNIGPVGLWWYTVDRWMLFGLILLGFIGLFFILLIILIYGFIIIRGFSKIQILNNYFNQLAASGLLLIFGLQTLFHMAVNLSLVPAKGMTLPFISYGGSSIMALGICMGMFLSLTKKDDPRIKSKNSDLNYSGIQF